MGVWWEFFKQDCSKSFHVWGKVGAMSAILPAFISLIIAAIPALALRYLTTGFFSNMFVAVGFVIWFLLLLFVVTPIRMAKEKVESTIPKLNVAMGGLRDTGWLHLEVENPTRRIIHRCYAKLTAFHCIKSEDSQNDLPSIPIAFPLSTGQGEKGILTDIGSDSSKVFDAIFCASDDYFEIVTMHPNQWTRLPQYHIGKGEYEMEIEIGSEGDDLQPTSKLYQVIFNGRKEMIISQI